MSDGTLNYDLALQHKKSKKLLISCIERDGLGRTIDTLMAIDFLVLPRLRDNTVSTTRFFGTFRSTFMRKML